MYPFHAGVKVLVSGRNTQLRYTGGEGDSSPISLVTSDDMAICRQEERNSVKDKTFNERGREAKCPRVWLCSEICLVK